MNTDKLSETDKIGGEEYKTSYHPSLRNLAFRLSYEDLKNSVSWLQTIEIDPVPFGKHDSIHPSIYQTKALKVGPAEYKLKSASIKNMAQQIRTVKTGSIVWTADVLTTIMEPGSETLRNRRVHMKAVICTNYGPPEVLQMKEVEKPKPKDHEVLIKVFAATAHIGDTRIRRADPFLVRLVFGMFKPRKNLILGLEISGVIESVGKDVQSFKEGDKVFGLTGFSGGYAEYICLPEKVKNGTGEKKGMVAIKPNHLSYEEAAVVPSGALTALKNLQKAKIKPGQKILINGASGSLGTYAIQLAKYYEAEVTAVCSKSNFGLVESIGADKVIDYTEEDFTASETKYDIVYDAVIKAKPSQCKKILTPNGVFLNNSRLPKMEAADLLFLKELIEENKLKPIIDRTYALDEIAEAHRYVDTGRKKGNVAITVR